MSLVDLSIDEINSLTVVNLKKYLRELNLPTTGTKPVLQERLVKAYNSLTQVPVQKEEMSQKSEEKDNNPSTATETNTSFKSSENNNQTQESVATSNMSSKSEKSDSNLDKHYRSDVDVDEGPKTSTDNNTFNNDINNTNTDKTAPQSKKVPNIKRIEMEGLPEELCIWEVEENDPARKGGISRNLGVTTAELLFQREKRLKKYGMQAMPEETKRILRKQRFQVLDKSQNNDTNKDSAPSANNTADNKDGVTTTEKPDKSDFSIQSVLGNDELSEGLTEEKLSQRRKRFGDAAITDAFNQSMKRNSERKTGNNNRRNQITTNNNNNNRQNFGTNQSNTRRNNRWNASDNNDRIKARMLRFGTKPQQENGTRNNNRRLNTARNWNTRNGKGRRQQDRSRAISRSNKDRSRSRERKRDKERTRRHEEVVESTIHPVGKTGGIMKDFGSDDDFQFSVEDLERIEQRRKRFEEQINQ